MSALAVTVPTLTVWLVREEIPVFTDEPSAGTERETNAAISRKISKAKLSLFLFAIAIILPLFC